MSLQRMLLLYTKLILVFCFCLPLSAFAHLLSITATSPFPAQLSIGSSASATFKITNTSSGTTVTAINQSRLPGSISVTSSTCGSPLTPGSFCTIQLTLTAPASSQTVSGELKMWAKPSADGTRYPISVVITSAVTPSAGTGGTISPNTVQTVASHSNITFVATPNAGYRINTWSVDGIPVQTGGSTYTLSDITTNHTVAVTFTQTFAITPSAGTGGAVDPSTTQTVDINGSVVFTATPTDGYIINEWKVDSSTVQTGGTTYTLNNITANHTVTVSFTQTFVITPSAGANGAISPSTPQTQNINSSLLLTAIPNTGYGVDEWQVDSIPVQTGGTTYTLSNITATHSVAVSFIQTFVVTPSAGANGSISPSTPQTQNTGSSLAFTATPSGGYSVNQWLVNSSVVQTGGNTYTLSNITAAKTVQVTFKTTSGAFVAAGADITGANPALVAVSTNAASTFATKTITNLPATGHFNASSCTGTVAATAVCIAAGNTEAGVVGPLTHVDYPALLAASTDGGGSWIVKVPAGTLPLSGVYNATTCTGTTTTATCIAAGEDVTSTLPLLALSIDGANSWTQPTITNPPVTGKLLGASCTGSGSTTRCAVVGQNLTTNAPYIAMSTNNGTSFATVTPTGTIPANGVFNSVSCRGSGSSSMCVAAGQDITNTKALLAVTTNGGANWAIQNFGGAPATGKFYGTGCSTADSICIAVGQKLSDNSPLLAVTTDGGTTWTDNITISGAPATGIFYGGSCTGSDSSAICVAVGKDLTSGKPLLAQSTDGTATWSVVSSPVFATTGFFTQANCTGNTTTAICIAAGGSQVSAQPPLLAVSTNGGSTWAVKSVTGAPATGKYYGAGGTAGTLAETLGLDGILN